MKVRLLGRKSNMVNFQIIRNNTLYHQSNFYQCPTIEPAKTTGTSNVKNPVDAENQTAETTQTKEPDESIGASGLIGNIRYYLRKLMNEAEWFQYLVKRTQRTPQDLASSIEKIRNHIKSLVDKL